MSCAKVRIRIVVNLILVFSFIVIVRIKVFRHSMHQGLLCRSDFGVYHVRIHVLRLHIHHLSCHNYWLNWLWWVLTYSIR